MLAQACICLMVGGVDCGCCGRIRGRGIRRIALCKGVVLDYNSKGGYTKHQTQRHQSI